MKTICMLSILLVSAAVSSAAVLVDLDFETDESSTFTVQNGAGDFVANFNYDYSTFAPQPGTTGPTSIPAAPSGAGTKGVRLEVNNNDAVAAIDAVTLFPNAAAGLTNYTLKCDVWLQYFGPGGGTGSTEALILGGHGNAGSAAWPSATAFTGFFVTATGDGDLTADYRYYEGSGAAPVRNDSTPNWNGVNHTEASDASWTALFPTPTYETAGAIGKAWTVYELVVNGSQSTVFVTPTGGTRTQVATWTVGSGLTQGHPFIGYWDVSSSIATVTADQFAVIDNLSITVPEVVNAAQDWQYLQ